MEVSLQRKNPKRRFLEKIRDSWGRIKLQHSRNHQSSVNHIYTKSYVPRSTGKPNHFRRMACFQALLSLHSHQIHSVGWYYDDDYRRKVDKLTTVRCCDEVVHERMAGCETTKKAKGPCRCLAFACGSFAPQKESWKKTDIRSVQLRKGLSDPARRAGDAATEIDVAKLRPRFEMVLLKLPS